MQKWRPLVRTRGFSTQALSHAGYARGGVSPRRTQQQKEDDNRTQFQKTGTVHLNEESGFDLPPSQTEFVADEPSPPTQYKEHTTSSDEQFQTEYTFPEEWKHKRSKGFRDLPLPPFLRPKKKGKDQFRGGQYLNIYREGNEKTMKENMKDATFSTLFATNPYAHALAVPVREDNVTRNRLPRSCMIDFHLVESADGESLVLSPVSLISTLISNRQKDKLRQDLSKFSGSHARKAAELEAKSFQPTGGASYILNRYDALKYISADTKHLRNLAISRRLNEALSKENINSPIHWKPNMADAVLAALRSITVHSLRYHFIAKRGSPDKRGMVAAVPGDGGLEGLDSVDDVLCVLQLTPEDHDAQTSSLDGVTALDEEMEETVKDDSGYPATAPTVEDSITPTVEESTAPTVEGSIPIHEPMSDGATEKIPGISSTYIDIRSAWTEREATRLPFRDMKRLPPPVRPSYGYYPTVPYRNRRVPLYKLHGLLGEQNLRKLLAGTVFENSQFLTLTQRPGTVKPQIALLKLQAYLAQPKGVVGFGLPEDTVPDSAQNESEHV